MWERARQNDCLRAREFLSFDVKVALEVFRFAGADMDGIFES